MREAYSKLQTASNNASCAPRLCFEPMQTMGERIRFLREARGLSQEGLADRLAKRGVKVSGNAISQWERGETQNIKLQTFLALVDELGTTHEYLVHGPSEPGQRDSTGRYRNLKPRNDNKP